jgi:enamine deaminase RidA (YjgF/YER057c/UK114 family)
MSTGKLSTVGRFSLARAVRADAGRTIYIAGTTAGPEAPFDVRAQAKVVFGKIEKLLAAEGATLADLVKITTYLVDMREYAAYNEVRNEIFRDAAEPPVSTTVGVTGLVRPDNRIEIEAIAIVPPR